MSLRLHPKTIYFSLGHKLDIFALCSSVPEMNLGAFALLTSRLRTFLKHMDGGKLALSYFQRNVLFEHGTDTDAHKHTYTFIFINACTP